MDENGRRMVAVILVAIMAVAVLAVAFTSGLIKFGSTTGSVLDAAGRNVEMDKPPERIVTCEPSLSEMVAALGLADKLVAVTEYCDYPDEVRELRDEGKIIIGGFYTPSFEAVIGFRPDLVLVDYGVESHRELADRLIDAGITVVQMFPEVDLESAYKNIELLGKVTGKSREAQDLIDSMKDRIEATVKSVATLEKIEKRNVMYVSYTDKGFTDVYVTGNGTAMNEIIELAGGKNVFGDFKGWGTPSSEHFVERAEKIDCIIITVMSNEEAASPKDLNDYFRSDEFWQKSPAVKNNRIFYLSGQGENIFNRQSVRIPEAIQLMAQMLYPEEFGWVLNESAPNEIGDDYKKYLLEQDIGAKTFSIATAIMRV